MHADPDLSYGIGNQQGQLHTFGADKPHRISKLATTVPCNLKSSILQDLQGVTVNHFTRQQSLVVDRVVDNLAMEAATCYGGTKKPAVAQALKKQLHKAAQRLPSLANTSSEPLPAVPAQVCFKANFCLELTLNTIKLELKQ